MNSQTAWLSDLMGMSQRQDPDKIAYNFSPFLLNISHDKPGTWAKRKGSIILGATDSGAGVKGLSTYEKNNGNSETRVIRDGGLEIYDPINDVFDASIGTGFGSNKVESVNFLRRSYHISPSLNLSYENGSGSLTSAVAIKGSCITASPSTLFVGNITSYNGSAVDYQDRVYYSVYDAQNNTPTHQFYESDETLATSTRYISIGSPIKAIKYYDSIGKLLVWTKNTCYSFDMMYQENATGIQSVCSIGCINQRAVTECNSWLIWMNNEARIWMYGGSGQPTEISFDIDDGAHKEAIINLISRTEFDNICAGTDGNKVYFSVGDITYQGVTYANCLLKAFLSQASSTILWSLDSYPYKASIFANTVIDGRKVLTMGCTDNNVYMLNSDNYSDNGTAISSLFRTAYLSNSKPVMDKTPDKLYVKYRPQSASPNYLYLKYAINGSTTYTTISDPDGTPAVTRFGKVNMYDTDYATKIDKIRVVKLETDSMYRTISIEGGNNQLNNGFEVSALGINITNTSELDIRPD